ncbi:MAG: hypothetical protein LKJ69_01680 [Lactobacillus sp.]|jgi:hypothetical protein|nr:hypothetical protein [Lactobacillus sp.]MCI2032094.1 hypothetical protein [Lactobacillus sp.]
MNEMELSFSEMKQLLRSAFTHARRANDFVSDHGERGEFAAVGEAACAYSDFRALWIYAKVKPDFDRGDLDDLMDKAAVFQHELSKNVATNHSHQWTDIEYGSLVKTGSRVAGLLREDKLFTDQEVTDYLSD